MVITAALLWDEVHFLLRVGSSAGCYLKDYVDPRWRGCCGLIEFHLLPPRAVLVLVSRPVTSITGWGLSLV